MLSGPNQQGITLPNISISPRHVYSVMKAPLDTGRSFRGLLMLGRGLTRAVRMCNPPCCHAAGSGYGTVLWLLFLNLGDFPRTGGNLLSEVFGFLLLIFGGCAALVGSRSGSWVRSAGHMRCLGLQPFQPGHPQTTEDFSAICQLPNPPCKPAGLCCRFYPVRKVLLGTGTRCMRQAATHEGERSLQLHSSAICKGDPNPGAQQDGCFEVFTIQLLFQNMEFAGLQRLPGRGLWKPTLCRQ